MSRVYRAELDDSSDGVQYERPPVQASVLLRTRNDVANHLGLPLPSGRVAVFEPRGGTNLLLNEAGLADRAVNEEFEIDVGVSADVQANEAIEERTVDSEHARKIPLVPGVALREVDVSAIRRVEITNARDEDIQLELMPSLEDGARSVRADHPLGSKNGHPLFRLTIPAHQAVTVLYQIAHARARAIRD